MRGKLCKALYLGIFLSGKSQENHCALISYRWAETLNTVLKHTVSSSWWMMPTAFGITFYSQTLMWVLC